MWNTLGASQGAKDSQYILGLMHENGEGVSQNIMESQKWFKLAAEQGMKEAQDKIIVKEEIKGKKPSHDDEPSKIVDKIDVYEVNKYLSNVEKEKNKTPSISNPKEREIIWN